MEEQISQHIEKCKGYELSLLQSEYSKRCQSNYLKNIIRSFSKFILERSDEVIITSLSSNETKSLNELRSEFVQFMKFKAYSQSTLTSLIKSQRFGRVLHYYLQYYTKSWLMESDFIKDFYGHAICIEYFKRAFEDQKILDSLKVYKKMKQNKFNFSKKYPLK